jgi:heme-degrading monooxygenase HmoA
MANPQHARIGFYTARPGDLDAVLERARDEVIPMLESEFGFRRYTVARTGPDTLVSITGWDSHEQAEMAARRLSAWVAEVMGPTLTSVENHVAEVISLTEGSADAPAYARVVVLQFKPGKGEEVSAKARTDFIPALQKQPGFIRHVAFQPGTDRTITFTGFASREQTEAAEMATQEWREYVAPLTVSRERHAGEVVWSIRKD